MASTLFRNLTEKDKNDAIERIISQSTPRDDFFLMVVLSVSMAVLGLLLNDIAVIIGSMLIAPLLSPILSLSLGVVIADAKVLTRSFLTLIKALVFALPVAVVITWIFKGQVDAYPTAEILARTNVSIIGAVIGFVAGFAASFAMMKPHLNNNLPGVAISVALIPPIAVTGVGLATFEWNMATSAFIVFVLNVAMIVFGSMVVFNLMRFFVKRGVAEAAVKKEDRQLAEEELKAEIESKREKNK